MQNSLALKSDGTVYAWGYNAYGQTNVPAGLNNVVAIACGGYHDLALKSDGTVVGWGDTLQAPVYGQATNNPAATNVVAIAAGNLHARLARRRVGGGLGIQLRRLDDMFQRRPPTSSPSPPVPASARRCARTEQWCNGAAGLPIIRCRPA